MKQLQAGDFAAFYRAVHGFDPFPWQMRLAELVLEHGWPDALDVPTGAGKTSAIDIAVFHLALQAGKQTRNAALRIAFVVDRRLVVDDAYRHAARIARALLNAGSSGVLRLVRDQLLSFTDGVLTSSSSPLAIARLRGGTPQDPDWARSPAQPTVIVSTVDQVGSRLFFRGYGVSNSMKPVHAGLLGADSLYLLDEAHLSMPLVTTLRDALTATAPVRAQDRRFIEPFSLVTLSATQTAEAPPLVTEEDERDRVLGRRLGARKMASLVAARVASDDKAFATAFVNEALAASSLGTGDAQITGVVVNRVKRARAVFEQLSQRLGRNLSGQVHAPSVALLIGRSRPLDRDRLLGTGEDGGLLERMKASRNEADPALIVVATQCVEAGADLDFDALVTEIAPLDCLVQRFGRLDRTGRSPEAHASIVAATDQVSSRSAPDRVYGGAPARTWSLLQQRAVAAKGAKRALIDFGIQSSREWLPARGDLAPYLAPRDSAPVLLPSFVEAWACTSPIPAHDPEVALFLHGPQSGPADVQIIWRADIEPTRTDEWAERVAACPPSALEAVSVPYMEAVRWLDGHAEGDVADVEGVGEGESPLRAARTTHRKALRWQGAGDSEVVSRPRQLGPGDTLVVPAQYGGCDTWGWNPSLVEAVTDVGREANLLHRGHDILRLAPGILRDEGVDASALPALLDELRDERDRLARDRVVEFLGDDGVWGDWRKAGVGVIRGSQGRPLALWRRAAPAVRIEAAGDATTESEMSCSGQRAVPLRDHSRGVGELARAFAERAGISPEIADDIGLAALLHDAGKARIEFKLWLYGGDEIAAAAGMPLAKSGRLVLGRRVRRTIGLPQGARHEVASLAFAANHPALATSHDRALVLWLIGTHHGHGRPFFPPVQWPPAGSRFEADLGDGHGVITSAETLALPELGAGWSDMRSSLIGRYGPWGLARFEAILRLADHRRSEAEQVEGEDGAADA